MCVRSKLTVFFDDPFWVAVCERVFDGKLEAARIVFGSEPRDNEVYGFLLKNWATLRYCAPVEAGWKQKPRVNPKRVQRLINRQLREKGPGTKAQQALKLQLEEGKNRRRQESSRMREANEERKHALKQEKKKQKHRGR